MAEKQSEARISGGLSKVHPPQLQWVDAPAELVDAIRAHPRVWLSGPSNPTASAAIASLRQGERLVWLRMDEGDADVPVVVRLLLEALSSTWPDVARHFTYSLVDGPSFAALRRALADVSGRSGLIVLEDFHRMPEQVAEVLLSVMDDELPPTLRMILTARPTARVPAGWTPIRAYGAEGSSSGEDPAALDAASVALSAVSTLRRDDELTLALQTLSLIPQVPWAAVEAVFDDEVLAELRSLAEDQPGLCGIDSDGWFRLAGELRDLLAAPVDTVLGTALLEELLRRRLHEWAVPLALGVGRVEEAARVLDAELFDFVIRGHVRSIGRQIAKIPEHLLTPRLLIAVPLAHGLVGERDGFDGTAWRGLSAGDLQSNLDALAFAAACLLFTMDNLAHDLAFEWLTELCPDGIVHVRDWSRTLSGPREREAVGVLLLVVFAGIAAGRLDAGVNLVDLHPHILEVFEGSPRWEPLLVEALLLSLSYWAGFEDVAPLAESIDAAVGEIADDPADMRSVFLDLQATQLFSDSGHSEAAATRLAGIRDRVGVMNLPMGDLWLDQLQALVDLAHLPDGEALDRLVSVCEATVETIAPAQMRSFPLRATHHLLDLGRVDLARRFADTVPSSSEADRGDVVQAALAETLDIRWAMRGGRVHHALRLLADLFQRDKMESRSAILRRTLSRLESDLQAATGSAEDAPAGADSSPDTPVQVAIRTLCAGIEVSVDGCQIPPPTGHAGRLLGLLLSAEGPQHNEFLMDACWPEATETSARNRLHVTTHRLRRALHIDTDGPLQRAGGMVWLERGSNLWADLWELESLRPGSLPAFERAVELYGGDFCFAQFAFEEFAADRRRHLRSHFETVVAHGIRRLHASDIVTVARYGDAVEAAANWIVEDEELSLMTLSLLLRTGRRQRAERLAGDTHRALGSLGWSTDDFVSSAKVLLGDIPRLPDLNV